MMSPETAAKLRSTREGQELIAHIEASIDALDVTVTAIEWGQTADGIAVEVVSRKRAIATLKELFHELTFVPTDMTATIAKKKEDAGIT